MMPIHIRYCIYFTCKAWLFISLLCVSFMFIPRAISQPECATAEYIESLNRGIIENRVAHIKGIQAKLFIALDPVWSVPEFDTVPYRHPNDMKIINETFAKLMGEDINEVIVWKFRPTPGGLRSGMGIAVPFKDGCAVGGYGEPDYIDKLEIMHETQLLIAEHGMNAPSVRDNIKKLIMDSPYASHYNDKMIDIIIEKLHISTPGAESSFSVNQGGN